MDVVGSWLSPWEVRVGLLVEYEEWSKGLLYISNYLLFISWDRSNHTSSIGFVMVLV